MARVPVHPIESDDGRFGKKLTHPAFGQIAVNRISGNSVLYGSDFQHHAFVRVTIYESELNRSLSKDWPYQRNVLAIVDLSEAQWASFVSSFNVGGGVPCTLVEIAGERKPAIPLRDEGQIYKTEADATLKQSIAELEALREKIKAGVSGLSKTRADEMLKHVDRSISSLNSSLPFVVDSFSEHMEQRTEKAKVEVNAYFTNMVMRSGIEALTGKPPLELSGPDEDGE
jgi:hypothetical protein